MRSVVRTVLTFLALVWILVMAGPAGHFLGLDTTLLPRVFGANGNFLGIDCAYGASADPPVPFPSPITTKDGDGTIDTKCLWAGDVDGDGHLDPLVSDNPGLLSAGSGGGFMADIIITSLNTSIDGFDQIISYDPHVLNALLVDQSGLTFGGNNGCLAGNPSCTLPTALTIDRTSGTVRVAQALIGATVGPGGNCNTTANPSCTSTTQTLFRIRFDIIAAGTSFISFSPDTTKNVIVSPAVVLHTTQNGALSTNALFALTNGVNSFTNGFNASWTFSPSLGVPGSPITFSAVASCGNCTGAFTYSWDFSSLDSSTYTPKVDATGATKTVTAPPPVINRVTLTVTDAASHSVTATRRLSLAATAAGPTSASQGTSTTAFNGKWLGGVVTTSSGYSGFWRFCPGTPSIKTVCDTPISPVSQNPPTVTETSTVSGVTFNFAGIYNDFLSISDTAVSQISATPSNVVAPVSINVTGPTPAFTVAVTPAPATQLTGQPIGFVIALSYASTYPVSLRANSFTYQVFYGDGTSITQTGGTTLPFLTHIYGSNGIFNVKVTAQEASLSAPSKIMETGTTSVDVAQQLLTGDFSFSPTSPTPGVSTTFTATASGGASPYTYAWSFGDGKNGTGSSPAHTYSSGGTYNVTLKITDYFGSTFSISHIVTVAPEGVSPLVIGGGAAAGLAVVAGLLLFLRRRKGASKPPLPPRGTSTRR
jgi:hypothetical protein